MYINTLSLNVLVYIENHNDDNFILLKFIPLRSCSFERNVKFTWQNVCAFKRKQSISIVSFSFEKFDINNLTNPIRENSSALYYTLTK
jgi:hypothetical protein